MTRRMAISHACQVLYPSSSLSCPTLHAMHVDLHHDLCLSGLASLPFFENRYHACCCTSTAGRFEYLVVGIHVLTVTT